MSFRLVPKSVTLNDLEWRNGTYFVLFQRIRVASGAHCVKVHIRWHNTARLSDEYSVADLYIQYIYTVRIISYIDDRQLSMHR